MKRHWLILLLIALWALVIMVAAPARRTARTSEAALPATELAQIDAQARTLCARHRATAGTVIVLPDGELLCTSAPATRRARSVITIPAHHQLAEVRP
jgi:hypothetical protein